jgi:hypothetical protein
LPITSVMTDTLSEVRERSLRLMYPPREQYKVQRERVAIRCHGPVSEGDIVVVHRFVRRIPLQRR